MPKSLDVLSIVIIFIRFHKLEVVFWEGHNMDVFSMWLKMFKNSASHCHSWSVTSSFLCFSRTLRPTATDGELRLIEVGSL